MSLRPPSSLETERLRLVPPRQADAQAVFEAYASDPAVTQYLSWRPHASVAVTREFLAGCEKHWQAGTAFPYLIFRKMDQKLLGCVEIRLDGHSADFGYVLGKAYWGVGYTVEAARPLLDWAMSQASIYRVWAICDHANTASARVLEKLGLEREGLLKRRIIHPQMSPLPRDVYSYAITK